MLARFEDLLVLEIRAAVLRLVLSADAYCLALNYGDDACHGCIPEVAMGLLEPGEVVKVPTGAVESENEYLWNPAEFSKVDAKALQPESRELLHLNLEIKSACLQGAEVDLRDLCNRVAVRLNRFDWSALPISSDFLVYAVDDDLRDLRKNLALARASRKFEHRSRRRSPVRKKSAHH